VRENWINLNGIWSFEFDFGKSGREQDFINRPSFTKQINVPFCPESKLSGIEYLDFMSAVWYKRSFLIPEDWKKKRVKVHFGAVDYDCEVWINGKSIGKHSGVILHFLLKLLNLL
jgi:beta-galactosidase/beta-glucuronidase